MEFHSVVFLCRLYKFFLRCIRCLVDEKMLYNLVSFSLDRYFRNASRLHLMGIVRIFGGYYSLYKEFVYKIHERLVIIWMGGVNGIKSL